MISPPKLKLESICGENSEEITKLEFGGMTFGRENDNNVVIDSLAVSRRHAGISQAGSQWVFRDYGSTNGSWVNGVQIIAGQVRLLRPGDIIRLGDFNMQLGEIDDVSSTAPECSVLVFFGDNFHQEYLLNQDSGRFVIGGPEPSLTIEGESRDQPQLVLVSYNGRIEVTTGKTRNPIIINGLAATGITTLSDRDEIMVGPYRLLLSDLSSASKKVSPSVKALHVAPVSGQEIPQAYVQHQLPEHLKQKPRDDGWESEAAKRQVRSGRKFIFDRAPDERAPTGTITLDLGELPPQRGYEVSSAQRFFSGMHRAENDAPFSKTNEIVLILMGIGVLVSILLFVGFLGYSIFLK